VQCDIPDSISAYMGAAREGEYMARLDELAEQAFDDQCTGANPRYPLISDLKQVRNASRRQAEMIAWHACH